MVIKEDDKSWVIFKYERLLNFYYNCGLLSQDLKDCSNSLGSNKLLEPKEYKKDLKGEQQGHNKKL